MAQTYYSPDGNPEVWDTKPDGYFTPEEWAELHPPVPYVPTKEEKLAALDADYMAQKSELVEQYTDAQIHGDSDTMAAIVNEMTALDEWYDDEYQKIINEEGE
jgi:hypothetical protein